MESNIKRQKLMIHVAKLYYEENCSQENIAELLHLSRPYISRLLTAAKNEGYVQIRVIDPFNVESPTEQLFREKYNLKKAVIVPAGSDPNSLKPIGDAAARYLNDILTDHMIIGTSWGGTLYECSRCLIPRTDLNDLIYVQMDGGVSNINKTVFASEIAGNFSAALNSTSYLMQIPAIVDNKRTKQLLQNDHSMKKIFEYGRRADVAIFTAGTFGSRSALVRAGYLQEADMDRLTAMGAVGDICAHVINKDGEICDPELDERTLAISLECIKTKKYRIGVGQGKSKIAALRAALRGGIINVLITNDITAASILQMDEEQQ